jgi:hypothetical protein
MTLDLPRITVYFRVYLSDTVGNWATAEHRLLVNINGPQCIYFVFPTLVSSFCVFLG